MRRLSSVITGGAFFALFALAGCSGGDGGERTEAAGDAAQMAQGDAMSGEAMADQQQAGQQKEEPGDAALIEQGREIYVGAGLCYACHGNGGEGIPGLGANLTDDEWLHADPSMEGIVQTILDGVPAEKSSTGTPMPPKGGSSITDDQVNAVAAFVLSLSGGGN